MPAVTVLEPLITAKQLELRLTPTVYTRVFNDWNNGEADQPADLQLREDASSKVRGALANTYDIDTLSAENPVFASELRRITLDVAHAYCAERNPTIVLLDWSALLEKAEKELKDLREDKTSLESGPDDGSGDPDVPTSNPDDTALEPTVEECRPLPGLGNFYG